MHNHAPESYDCPFCDVVRGVPRPLPYTQLEDIVRRGELVTAFISSCWWPNNPGHVVIVPNEHFENLYELPAHYGAAIHDMSRVIALALKAVCGCDGISTRQHNEPSGGQDVWHYHLQVFPRYMDDNLYVLTPERRTTTPEERRPYAERLRAFLTQQPSV
ncbi:HIT domain-containing protein [Deinococcus sp. SDU3-2]|uniref:HIT domain-containing protein n=1 Tax=Deinococcus terrestris TaxID=2651870 RepID=A0A7X1TRD2_9DEIO|nr:HIT domain-containing protein [Deinococcus terrestris]MPY66673.1 HIT domain-containing protein [Deinococcus terrestris]